MIMVDGKKIIRDIPKSTQSISIVVHDNKYDQKHLENLWTPAKLDVDYLLSTVNYLSYTETSQIQ